MKFSNYDPAAPVDAAQDILMIGQPDGADHALKTISPENLLSGFRDTANGFAALDATGQVNPAVLPSDLAHLGDIPAPVRTVSVYVDGKPLANTVVFKSFMPLQCSITADSFKLVASVAPAGSPVWTIKLNGSTIGSISWAAGNTVPTVSITGGVASIAEDDLLEVACPATADTAISGIALRIKVTA